eukprot:m.36515 g.36515  ORF g.36515 m.36515 type:complete len:316 (-) comp7582_c0_seq2:1433-2380(-)
MLHDCLDLGWHRPGRSARSSRTSIHSPIAQTLVLLIGATSAQLQSTAPPTADPTIAPTIPPTNNPTSTPTAQPSSSPLAANVTSTPTLAEQASITERLSTAEVVGVCLTANIVGVLLVGASLWFNARNPQFRSDTPTQRKQASLNAEPPSTSTRRESAMSANADGYLGISGSPTQKPAPGPECHQYAEIGAPGANPIVPPPQPNPYALSRLDERSAVSPDVFSGFGDDDYSDQGLPSPPSPLSPAVHLSDPEPVVCESKAMPPASKPSSRSSSRRSKSSKRGGSKKFNKLDISGPSDFRHEAHIGLNDSAVSPTP